MQNTRELILAKLYEINDLLANATCDGLPIEAADDCADVWKELTGKVGELEQAVEYYVD
jgi:hypothetical protein